MHASLSHDRLYPVLASGRSPVWTTIPISSFSCLLCLASAARAADVRDLIRQPDLVLLVSAVAAFVIVLVLKG